MSKYFGITVGPINQTVSMTTSPAGLWFASTLFSDITRLLCSTIMDEFPETVELLSPYFDKENHEASFLTDGVGKYHDRIIGVIHDAEATEEVVSKGLNNIILKVKKDILHDFPEEIISGIGADNVGDFLDKYLSIHFAILDETQIGEFNAVSCFAHLLDSLELVQNASVNDDYNPFSRMFFCKGDKRNSLIKSSGLYKKIKDSRVNVSTSIEELSGCFGNVAVDDSLKKYKYFAMVCSDADNMTALTEKFHNVDIKKFSKVCFDYTDKAVKMIRDYGGLPIYAGGDDLLFIAPVESTSGENIIGLCQRINKSYCNEIDILKKEIPVINKQYVPSISFGISIQYHKLPLYEALANAKRLLFAVAKTSKNKNTIAVELQKHSGQTLDFKMPTTCGILDCLLLLESDQDASVIWTITNQLKSFEILDKVVQRQKIDGNIRMVMGAAWANFRDNAGQKQTAEYFNEIMEIYISNFIEEDAVDIRDFSRKDTTNIETMLTLLRFKKFLGEKKGEE